MSYLNWKSAGVAIARSEHPSLQTLLTVTLSPERMGELRAFLTEAFADNREARVDLPASWTLYWKVRTGQSRAQLAHPGKDEWVATLSLARAHADRVLERLGTGETFSLSELGESGPFSNFELVVAPR